MSISYTPPNPNPYHSNEIGITRPFQEHIITTNPAEEEEIELRVMTRMTDSTEIENEQQFSCNIARKFIITAIAISAIDLTASIVNPLVDNNTFGRLKSSGRGLALLSSLLQSNLAAEIIYGPWESVYSIWQQFGVVGSQVSVAVLCDIIVSRKLGMSSSIGMTIAWSLICRTISYALYEKRTYRVITINENTQEGQSPQLNLRKRYAINGVAIFVFDLAAATFNRTLDPSSQVALLTTLTYGSISSRFTLMLYTQIAQSDQRDKCSLVLPGRMLSIALTQTVIGLIIPHGGIAGSMGPMTATALGSVFLLGCRITMEKLYNDEQMPANNRSTVIFSTNGSQVSTNKLVANTSLLILSTLVTAVANRILTSSNGMLVSNVLYATANMQLTRGLFENVKKGTPQAFVVVGQLISAYAIEQITNRVIPGIPLDNGWSQYIGRMTYIAMATASTFASTMFVNWLWRDESN